MPKAELPTGAKGWLVTIIASLAGFIAGLVTIKLLSSLLD